MDDSALSSNPANTLTPCGLGCRFAEPLRGDYAEWIWCSRPGAATRVHHATSECHFFADGKLFVTPSDSDQAIDSTHQPPVS